VQYMQALRVRLASYARRPKPRAYRRVRAWFVTQTRRTQVGVVIGILLLPSMIALFHVIGILRLEPRYQLAETAMLGKTSKTLAKKVSYDKKKNAYIFNKEAVKSTQKGPAAALSTQTTSDASTAKDNSYTASVTKGDNGTVTVSNPELDVSFSIVPTFHTYEGRQYSNRLSYPLKDTDASVVYSFKNNGIKEDVMLTKNIGDTLSLQYELKLPKSLATHAMTDGGIGVYSADPILYSNVTFGSDKDQALVEKAKENGAKNNLVFVIPSPTITQAHPSNKASPTARFTLDTPAADGSQLFTMHAKGLNRANYPLSIDPSIVVSSASDFMTGNNEDNITYTTGSAARDAIATGGALSPWTTTTGFTGYRSGHTSVAYNGYMYIIGGFGASGYLADTQYAPINTNGTLGTWTATTSLPIGRQGHTSVAYNGYMYVIGGDVNSTYSNDTQYAPINANGTLGAWTASTNFTTSRFGHTSVAYNGYMYVIGGYTFGTAVADTQYAAINANGTLGAWATSTSFTTARYGHTTVAYNGFMYIMGGYTSATYLADTQYAPINANGTLGTWTASTSFTGLRYQHTSVVDNGFVYIIGGTGPGNYADTQYAPINANGTLGAWTASNSFTTARYQHTSVAYNGYVYILGGQGAPPDVQMSNIASIGNISLWTATTALSAGRYQHTSVVYNGYMYVIGGKTNSGFMSDVQYAPINANGTLGAWTATTSFTTARSIHTSVAYNGYMYVMGGFNNAYLASTQYAPINANGTIGAWTATTSFTGTRSGHTSVAYNGYMYVMGGYNGSAYLADTQYAVINANGTLGTWTASTSFTTGRQGHTSVIYNGYVYIMGGQGAGTYNDVQYAVLVANGTVGVWASTTSFTTARTGHTSVVYNGYMYILGGDNGGPLADTQFAVINANATLGAWTATTSIPTARYTHTSVVYNGYVYVTGGSIGTTVYNADTQYAPLIGVTSGAVSAWTATTSFPTARLAHTSVAYNGYMYVVGGYGASAPLSDVQYAPIAANGTLGAWTATTSFTTARNAHTTVVYNGYMYVMGGLNATPAALNDTQYAPIAANGTLGAWTATTSFTTARAAATSVVYNGYVYMIGGKNTAGTAFSDTQYAAIAANGTIGAWTATTSFTNARSYHTSVVYNGYVYIIGGYTGSANLNDTQYATLNANGTIGAWAATTSFTTGRYGHTSVAYNGYVYVMGGYNGTAFLNDTQYATLNANGTIGAWSTAASFTTSRYFHASVVYNGYVYIIGGYTGTANLADVQYASIAGLSATTGTWATTSAFTTTRFANASVAYNGYMYVMGGYNGTTYLADTQYAAINANGSLGAWATTTSFTTGRYGHTSVVHNGYVYVMGGYNGTTYLADVQYAPINANGTLGVWTATTGFTGIRYLHTAAVYNGYAYVIGGYNGVALADTQYAPINANGTLGAWTASTSFPTARYGHSSVAYSGYVYVMGGYTGATPLNDTRYAVINANGTLGAWATTTSFATIRNYHTSVAYNGYMYVMGGYSGGALTDTQYAPINANGTLGAWLTNPSLIGNRYEHASVIYNGYVYVLGGNDGTGALNTVQYVAMGPPTPAAVAHYSRLFDIGTVSGLTSIAATYTGGGNADLSFVTADATGVFTGSRTISNYISGTSIALTGTARYVRVRVALSDDNNKAQSAAVGTAITNITLNYTAQHTPVDSYLRGGTYFNGGVKQPFDTLPE